MSVAMPSMASRLSLDFTKNVTLSHCHIGALLRDAPTNSRHPPAPHQLPRGGRELLVQGLRRIIIGRKIEIYRRNRENRRIEIIENNRKNRNNSNLKLLYIIIYNNSVVLLSLPPLSPRRADTILRADATM